MLQRGGAHQSVGEVGGFLRESSDRVGLVATNDGEKEGWAPSCLLPEAPSSCLYSQSALRADAQLRA